MFHQTVRFNKLTSYIPKTYRYKGLAFPLHEASLESISNEIELGGKITANPLYAFFGGKLLTSTQIRERVNIMVKNGDHRHTPAPATPAMA